MDRRMHTFLKFTTKTRRSQFLNCGHLRKCSH